MSRNPLPTAAFAAAATCIIAIIAAPAVIQAAGRASARSEAAHPAIDAVSRERGRYVAQTSGCNDCHTASYMPQAGRVPESEWLKGDVMGWRGPWGTTYAPNLRIFMSRLTEDQWVSYARHAELRPPMPWFGLRQMSEVDLRSIYRFVRSLGAPGEPAPAYLPPGVEPQGPYATFPAPPPVATTAKAN